MKRFFIILIAINSSQDINPELFSKYTLETADILIENYSWWPMSPTVHKVLMHGHDIISYAILPVGEFSIFTVNFHSEKFIIPMDII